MEQEPFQRSELDQVINERRAQGWTLAGVETLLRDQYQDGKFEPVQYQTEDEVRQRYLEKLQTEADLLNIVDRFDIELVLRPPQTFRGESMPDKYQHFLIFVRKGPLLESEEK